MNRKICVALVLVVGGIVASVGLDPARAATMADAPEPAKVAALFPVQGSGWRVEPRGYGGPADGRWTYALGGEKSWSDYAAEFEWTLVQPADRRDGLELGAFTNYHAMTNLGGYEAAAIVRYESDARHYRVAVSTLWKEVILWRPTGGVVQVASFPFETGKPVRLRIECRGNNIAVIVDGKPLIDWWDRADPVLQGRVGVGRKEGEAYVSRAKIESLPPELRAAPPWQPAFREQEWHGERWFFDGSQPTFVLTRGNVVDLMRIRPGYRASMYAFNYVTDWAEFQPTRITDSKVVESGSSLVFESTAVDPNRKNSISSHARLKVTYDGEKDLYVYDHSCTTTIGSLEDALKVAPQWDHGDAVFLGCVGSAQTRDPQAYRGKYQWTVFQAPDGKHYKVPLNPNFHYLSRSSSNGGPLRHDGGILLAVGDPVLNPVIRIPELPRDASNIHAGLCWWAFDVHTMFTPKTVEGKVAPTSYTSRVIYTGMNADESRRLLDQAEFYEPLDLSPRIPVFTAGIGHVEPFDKQVLLASPHSEHRIWSGVFDSSVGHDDSTSLRIDGPTEAWTLAGPSYFTSPFGKKVIVSAWVKTRDVQGEGPAIGFHRMDDNRGEFHCTGLTGTRDWTHVRYATTFPTDVFGAHVFFRNSGSGTVWFDDFKIEPVDENFGPEIPAAQNYPRDPRYPDLILNWDGTGDGGSLRDASGYGHHAKVYGKADFTEVDGKRSLILDGASTYLWPLHSPALTFGLPCTMSLRFRPETAGTLCVWGFQFTCRLVGGPDLLAVEYQPAGTKTIASKPFIKMNEWQRLTLVFHEDRIALYLDGRFVEDLVVPPRAGNWTLQVQSTWHRHLAFFGMGPGDMSLIEEPSSYHLKGQVGGMQVIRKALSPDQVLKLQAFD